MRALLELIGGFFADILASHFLRPLTEPLARFSSTLAGWVRPHLTIPILILAWMVAVGLMVFGWHLGTVHGSALWTSLGLLLWFGAPLCAIGLTALWYDRGRAA